MDRNEIEEITVPLVKEEEMYQLSTLVTATLMADQSDVKQLNMIRGLLGVYPTFYGKEMALPYTFIFVKKKVYFKTEDGEDRYGIFYQEPFAGVCDYIISMNSVEAMEEEYYRAHFYDEDMLKLDFFTKEEVQSGVISKTRLFEYYTWINFVNGGLKTIGAQFTKKPIA